jgi:SAM-dependent methyltransferase
MPNLPNVDRLNAQFQNTSPIFHGIVSKGRLFGNIWEMEMDETISRLWKSDEKLASAVKGYEHFALEIIRLQIDFERSGVYAPQTYDEANASVYQADGYMTDTYLPGLLLAWYLWPHHYRQTRFFKAFVQYMARSGAKKFYEVATGTGLYSRFALQGAQEAVGVGFDISPASCTFTENHLGAFRLGSRYEMRMQNVLEDEPEPVDWLICVELIEHMEDPTILLGSLRRMLKPGGKAFLATAINAPNSDHIYLLRNGQEATDLIQSAGFRIESAELNAAYPGLTPPMVAAFVVS